MRNAAAFDDDLDYDAPPRKSPPRKPRAAARTPKKKPGKGARRRRFDMQRVARYAAIAMAATMATGIMVNALVLQKGHHPAPLFGKAAAPAPTQTTQKAPAPLPPVRTTQADEPAAAKPEAKPATPAKTHRTIVASREAEASSPDDAIGRLLAGGTAASRGEKTETKTVSGVQRALTKLGFKVPATGTMGPVTRKAIEAFEKDRHLPIKGDVDRRLVKVLAAESGIKID